MWPEPKRRRNRRCFWQVFGIFFPDTSAPEQGGDGEDSNGGLETMATGEYLRVGDDEAPDQKLLELSEERVFAQIGVSSEHRDHRVWILDTGATNHMTGARRAFSELDCDRTSSEGVRRQDQLK
jgi:hypothetical protein